MKSRLKPETVYVQDVPLSFFEHCLKRADTPEQRSILKKIIRQFKNRRSGEKKNV